MDLESIDLTVYFEQHQGQGVLATADADGRVDVAIYARPHIMPDETVGFIMRDRLSHQNLQSNPQAAYLFHCHGAGYEGLRLYLTKVAENTDEELINTLSRRAACSTDHIDEKRFLVYFKVERIRPLVGDE